MQQIPTRGKTYSLWRTSSKEDGDEFWQSMGRFFASRELATELGGPVYDGNDYTWVVTTRGDEVVGFGAVRMHKNGTAFLDWSWVDPGHRKKGLYRKMLAVRIHLARELGATKLRTATRSDHVRGVFEGEGFEKSYDRGEWTYYERGATK